MNKKFVFIASQLYPKYVGGAEVFNYYLISQLSKEYKVSYLSLSNANIKETKYVSLKFKRFMWNYLLILKYILFNVRSKDLVVMSFMRTKWYNIAAYPLLNIFFRKNYILIIHGGGLTKWEYQLPYKMLFKRAKKVYGVSQVICEEYHKRTNVEINYLPPLIPFEKTKIEKRVLFEKYKVNPSDNIFLYVGSLKPLKQPEVILEAFVKLGVDYLQTNRIKLFFAGNGVLFDKLDTIIKDNHLQNHITLLGVVPRNEINELYGLAKNYIISSDFEGTPIAMLEAMFNANTIIASDVSGINSIINDTNGFLFNNKNVDSLVKVIQNVVTQDTSQLSKRALQDFESKFNYNRVLKEVQAQL